MEETSATPPRCLAGPGNRSVAEALNTRQPLLYAALAFASGIGFGNYCWRPASWWITAVTVFAASALLLVKHRPRASSLVALALWFWLGALNIQLRPAPTVPNLANFATHSDLLITAHVVHEGYLREAGFNGLRRTIDIDTEEISNGAEHHNAKLRIRLGIYSKETEQPAMDAAAAAPAYHYGQRLRFMGKLREPQNYGNPGSFDYRDYLREQGIVALASTKEETVEILPGFSGTWMQSGRNRIHRQIIQHIHRLWPDAQAALMDAAVIGEDAYLEHSTRVDFQRSGTYHILVVSGMNLSILAFVVFWTLRRLRMSEVLASVLTIVLSVGYAWLTGVGAPVWRATLMMAFYLGARLVYRGRKMLNTVGAAALGLMIIDPKSLLGASFQLTFLSVLIVAALAIPVLERTSQCYRRSLRHLETVTVDASLEPQAAQFRVEIRMVARQLARFTGPRAAPLILAWPCSAGLAMFEVLAVSALMQVGLALPMAWYFHRATVIGLPSNALAVPLTELLMPSSVLAIVLGFFSHAAATLPAAIAGIALQGITATVHGLGSIRAAEVRVALPCAWLTAAALLSLVGSMILARRRRLLACAGISALVISALLVAFVPAQPKLRRHVLEFTSIDVGQGDSTLVISPEGRTLLIDAGGMPGSGHSNFDIGEDVVSPYLWSRGLSRIDAVVATHGHWDHVGGMHAVLTNFRPHELWVGSNSPTPALAALIEYAKQEGITVRRLGAGDEIAYGGISIRVLAPVKDHERRRPNDDCLAMKLVFGHNSVLMEGDAEEATERDIVQEEPAAQLLKVGHHGSATSTSRELLAAVHPQAAVISVGRGNSYGHPRYQVLQRLEEAGAAVYRTDMNGQVTFYMDGESIKADLR